MIGQTIGGYRIVEKLGEGGFGIVYKALEVKLEREVAVKTMDTVLTRDPKFRERFFAEARMQAKLKHPNIVTIYTFLEHDGGYFIVMEYLEGTVLPGGQRVRNLAELVKLGPTPEPRVREMFGQILAAVGCAHRHGVLHRDIKPLNILFAESGLVKVGDFGIAKIVGGETNIAVSGTRVGTPAYMSPEQVLNKPLDARTDIYSLGCTLYEMAVGGMPFQATSTTSLEEQHLTVPPPPPRQRNPWLSAGLEQVILKAMQKKPEERFQTCEEFLAALEGRPVAKAACEPEFGVRTIPEPVSAEPGTGERGTRSAERGVRSADGGKRPAVRGQRPASSGRRLAVGVLAAVVGLVVAVVAGFLLLRRPAAAVATEFPLPNLAGSELAAAQQTARDKGLVLVTADSTFSDDFARGAVTASAPAAGATVRKGDTVRVTFCRGRRTCPQCHTPRKGTAKFCTRCGKEF